MLRPLPPGAALLPLRLFLGATFAYAGVQKLSDAGFLHAGADTYIGDQLEGFAQGTPGGPLLEALALPHPEIAGVRGRADGDRDRAARDRRALHAPGGGRRGSASALCCS